MQSSLTFSKDQKMLLCEIYETKNCRTDNKFDAEVLKLYSQLFAYFNTEQKIVLLKFERYPVSDLIEIKFSSQ